MTTPSHQQRPVSQNTPSSSNGRHQDMTRKLATLQSKGVQPQKKERFASWTGFSGKTLWDWLQLLAVLAVPLAVAFGTTYFAYQQANQSDIQHQRDVDAAYLQHQETILKSYQDDLKDLMLTRGLIPSKPNDEVRVIARTEVLSALRQLDSIRNRVFLQFLQDAHLIGGGVDDKGILQLHNVISFSGADLTGDFLEGVNLHDADLSGAYLSLANLSHADLSHADLSHATVTQSQLDTARSLSGTIMHDGSIHP